MNAAENTWTTKNEYLEPFRFRIRSLFKMIELEKISSVLDLGSGKNFAFEEMPENLKQRIRYIPVDALPVTPITIVKDFNKNEFPDQFADLALCSGIFEYIWNCDGFIKNICRHCNYCLGSYHFVEDTKDDRPPIWVNRLTKEDFISMFSKYGFEAEIIEREYPKQEFEQSLFLFKKKSAFRRFLTKMRIFSENISFKMKGALK